MWTPRVIPTEWEAVRIALLDATPQRALPPGPTIDDLESAVHAVRVIENSISRVPKENTDLDSEYVSVVSAALQLARFGAVLREDLKFRPTWEALDALYTRLQNQN